MSSTVSLRGVLNTLLGDVCSTYYEEASGSRSYPYLVYEMNEIGFSDGMIRIALEINIFDTGDDSSQVENIADALQDGFNKFYYIDDKIQFSVYRGTRQTIRGEGKRILRRRLLFEIHLHVRKGE